MRLPTLYMSFIAICLVFVPGRVQVQNEELESITIYIDFGEEYANSESELLDQLNIQLSRYNIETNLVDVAETANIALSLYFTEDWVEIETITPDTLSESLILFPHISLFDSWGATPEDFLSSEYHIQGLTGIALYTIGRCDLASDIFVSLPLSSYEHLAAEYLLSFAFYAGNCELSLGNYEDAAAYYVQALDMYSGVARPEASINLAWLLLPERELEWDNTIDFDAAMSAVGCNPFDDWCDVEYKIVVTPRRARLYALAFDYDSAIADMDEIISLAENDEFDNRTLARLYTTRGEIIFLIYEWDRVEDNFNTAIELDPTYAPAYFQRGVLFYTMARREDAMADFETYLELEPDGIYAEDAQSYIDSIEAGE